MTRHDGIAQLKAFGKTKGFFVGVDSDGCALDTMEIKQQECFIPCTILHYRLQAVSRFVRETEGWVSLHSHWRGSNRFPALVKTLDLLAERPECIERGYKAPDVAALRQWIRQDSQLGNPALEAKVAATGDGVLARALAWSRDVNTAIERIVFGVPPFPHVREALAALQDAADVVIVSATPHEALLREWQEHDLARYAKMICGQELGTKKDHLQHVAGGKYAPDNCLMVGDAMGDLRAARANGMCFYPINPGHEAQSWQRFRDEAMGLFLAGRYRGAYEDKLIGEFEDLLPTTPPWKRVVDGLPASAGRALAES
jgi:phosphoglycolate phosphatase-like HAD superfamily hydrolase